MKIVEAALRLVGDLRWHNLHHRDPHRVTGEEGRGPYFLK